MMVIDWEWWGMLALGAGVTGTILFSLRLLFESFYDSY